MRPHQPISLPLLLILAGLLIIATPAAVALACVPTGDGEMLPVGHVDATVELPGGG